MKYKHEIAINREGFFSVIYYRITENEYGFEALGKRQCNTLQKINLQIFREIRKTLIEDLEEKVPEHEGILYEIEDMSYLEEDI